jgi:hypothetical protein
VPLILLSAHTQLIVAHHRKAKLAIGDQALDGDALQSQEKDAALQDQPRKAETPALHAGSSQPHEAVDGNYQEAQTSLPKPCCCLTFKKHRRAEGGDPII